MIGQYLKIWNLRMQKNLNIEKIIFKVVQMKFLAMHINNQKLSFDIFMVGSWQNIFMEHDLNILMIFGIKEKCIILTYNVLLAIATNYTRAPGSRNPLFPLSGRTVLRTVRYGSGCISTWARYGARLDSRACAWRHHSGSVTCLLPGS